MCLHRPIIRRLFLAAALLALAAWTTMPLAAAPGEVDGLPYDPARDTLGGLGQYGVWKDQQTANGVPDIDAARIAFAHLRHWCRWEQGGADRCADTGFDLSRVDVNDMHANFGFNPECETWGVDFTPWWGMWDPPAGQPGCAGRGGRVGEHRATSAAPYSPAGGNDTPARGAGGDGGAAPGGGGGSGGVAAGLAQGILAGLDFKTLLTSVIKGLWELLVGDGIEQVGEEVAAFMLATPNLLATEGGMANVQGVVDALRLAALGACLVMFAFTVAQFAAGREEAPQAALGRLLAVMVALGFYRTFVGWLLRGAHELAFGVRSIGADSTTGVFTAALKALVPVAAPFWYILSIVGSGLVIAVGVVKILGLAFLLLTYAAGPLLLPLAIHPRTAGWVGLWAEHLVKVLLWPVLWALQFRLFGAIAGGLTFVDAQGNVNLGVGALGALTSLAMLVIMAGTPWTLHTKFTVARYGGFVARQAGRAVDAAVLVATGGASWSVKGAAALALRQRSGSQAAKSRQAGSGD